MSRKFKTVFFGFLVLLGCMLISSCVKKEDEVTPPVPPETLATPSGLHLVDDDLVWDVVSHATSYNVQIEAVTSSRISVTTAKAHVLDSYLGKSLIVQAISTDSQYLDSEWSTPYYIRQNLAEDPIKLSTPTGVKQELEEIIWNSVLHASGYYVSADGLSSNLSTTETRIAIPDGYIGKTVRVQAYTNSSQYVNSEWSEPITILDLSGVTLTRLDTPYGINLVLPQSDEDSYKINWEPVADATSYSVFVVEFGEYVSVTESQLDLIDLGNFWYYSEFQVKAITNNPEYLDSVWSTPYLFNIMNLDGMAFINAPFRLSYDQTYLTWQKVIMADSYNVEISGITPNLSVTDCRIEIIPAYIGKTIRIQAVISFDTSMNSEWSIPYQVVSSDSGTPSPLGTPVVSQTGSLVSWPAIPHANYYLINFPENVAVLIVQEPKLDLSGFDYQEYLIRVQAISDSSLYLNSSWSNQLQTIDSRVKLAFPTGIKLELEQGLIVWDAVPQAQGYRIIGHAYGTGSWGEINLTVTENRLVLDPTWGMIDGYITSLGDGVINRDSDSFAFIFLLTNYTVAQPTYSGPALHYGDPLPEIETTTEGVVQLVYGQTLSVTQSSYNWHFTFSDGHHEEGTINLTVLPVIITPELVYESPINIEDGFPFYEGGIVEAIGGRGVFIGTIYLGIKDEFDGGWTAIHEELIEGTHPYQWFFLPENDNPNIVFTCYTGEIYFTVKAIHLLPENPSYLPQYFHPGDPLPQLFFPAQNSEGIAINGTVSFQEGWTIQSGVYSYNWEFTPENDDVRWDHYTGQITISLEYPITGIMIIGSSELYLGSDQVTYSVEVNPYPYVNNIVNWSSSNEIVATIRWDGLVTVLTTGSFTITATSIANPSITQELEVTVVFPPATGMEITTLIPEYLYVGDVLDLVVVIAPALADQTYNFSISDPTILEIVEGRLTILNAGQVTLNIYPVGYPALSESFTINVVDPISSLKSKLDVISGQDHSLTDEAYNGKLFSTSYTFMAYLLSYEGEFRSLPTIGYLLSEGVWHDFSYNEELRLFYQKFYFKTGYNTVSAQTINDKKAYSTADLSYLGDNTIGYYYGPLLDALNSIAFIYLYDHLEITLQINGEIEEVIGVYYYRNETYHVHYRLSLENPEELSDLEGFASFNYEPDWTIANFTDIMNDILLNPFVRESIPSEGLVNLPIPSVEQYGYKIATPSNYEPIVLRVSWNMIHLSIKGFEGSAISDYDALLYAIQSVEYHADYYHTFYPIYDYRERGTAAEAQIIVDATESGMLVIRSLSYQYPKTWPENVRDYPALVSTVDFVIEGIFLSNPPTIRVYYLYGVGDPNQIVTDYTQILQTAGWRSVSTTTGQQLQNSIHTKQVEFSIVALSGYLDIIFSDADGLA